MTQPGRNTKTPLLDGVDFPSDLRALKEDELRQLADELRQEVIDTVSVTGGHLGAGLGVVELTVVLHYLFDTPRDKLIWDVGHQCYPHKILTGRRDRIRTLRQGAKISRCGQADRPGRGRGQGDLRGPFGDRGRPRQGPRPDRGGLRPP